VYLLHCIERKILTKVEFYAAIHDDQVMRFCC